MYICWCKNIPRRDSNYERSHFNTVHSTFIILFTSGCTQQHKSSQQHQVDASMYAKHQSKINTDWTPYKGQIYHIFFHPVITKPKLAFNSKNPSAKGNNDWMVTTKEFKATIEELHKNNFILIDPHDAFDFESSPIKKKTLKLPKNKKPLILSIDDINYYDYMRGKGYDDRLVLDESQHVVSETKDKHGKLIHSKKDDIVPILNDFVKDHSDFSLNGQKGVIGLTGYSGVLGYRTNETDNKAYDQRKRDAIKVVEAMKRDGWTFASHSYGHINFKKSSYKEIVNDTKKWEKEVAPIVGKTELFIFPHGAQDRNTPAYHFLIKEGHFKYFAGVGPNNFTDISTDNVYQDRVAIDGLNLYEFKYKLKPFVTPEKVYNKEDRAYFKGNKSYEN